MGWWAQASVGCTVLQVYMWRGELCIVKFIWNWAAPKKLSGLCTKNGTKYNIYNYLYVYYLMELF